MGTKRHKRRRTLKAIKKAIEKKKETSPAERMDRAFRKVRNRLRRYNPREIIQQCIAHLMRPNAYEVQSMREAPPWLLLLLLKWTARHGDYQAQDLRSLRKDRDFPSLINLMHDLNGEVRLPSEYENHFLFFRNLAFQQFWLWERSTLAARLARQSILFGQLEPNHTLQRLFSEATGVRIDDFIELALALLTRFIQQDEVYVAQSWLRSVEKSDAEGAVENFFSAVSRDLESLQAYLDELEPSPQNVSYEFYEQSPLKRYPLLRLGDRYYCYSRPLLFHALQTFVYDTLRGSNAQVFMDKFGGIFESYVGRAIEYSGLPFVTESELQRELDTDQKLVDFLLTDDDVNIFVEAKGVEMVPLGMVSHDAQIVQDKTRSSVLKGVIQAFETAKQLSEISQVQGLPFGKGDNFLLVVTFKDLYIGNGRDFYQYIAEGRLEAIVDNFGGPVIPFENMYFISIDDLDFLVHCLATQGVGLANILRRAREADREPATAKFVFRQHLLEMCPENGVPSYLTDELANVRNRMAPKFEQ